MLRFRNIHHSHYSRRVSSQPKRRLLNTTAQPRNPRNSFRLARFGFPEITWVTVIEIRICRKCAANCLGEQHRRLSVQNLVSDRGRDDFRGHRGHRDRHDRRGHRGHYQCDYGRRYGCHCHGVHRDDRRTDHSNRSKHVLWSKP